MKVNLQANKVSGKVNRPVKELSLQEEQPTFPTLDSIKGNRSCPSVLRSALFP
jgi:hypothetical protein